MKKLFIILSIFAYLLNPLTLTSQNSILKNSKKMFVHKGNTDILENHESEDIKIPKTEIIKNIGRIIGIFSIFLLGLSLFIGASARLFDKYFGLEKILRIHKKFSYFSFSILVLHPILIILSNMLEGYPLTDFYIDYLGYIPFIFGHIAFYIFLLIILFSLYFKYVNYTTWLTTMRLSIIAIIFASYHQINYGHFSNFYEKINYFHILIFIGWTAAASGLIIRIIIYIIKPKRISYIKSIRKETHDTTSIIIEKPKGFKYNSGQFCFISFFKKSMKKPHPFTISSSSSNDEDLVFTIKAIGKFTSQIPSLKEGEQIKIDGPYGIFTFKKKDAVLIAGGVGITPFRSIIGDLRFFDKKSKITLIYANKTSNDIIFNNKLESVKRSHVINIVHILSNEKKQGYEFGYISEDLLKNHTNFKSDFYLCGPPPMIKTLLKILKRNKVPSKRIYREKFFW